MTTTKSPKAQRRLPPIPDKRYFTIGEASQLCAVKSHVLRYWEQEFPQLSPNKRRGNRRYYQKNDILFIRDLKSLLHEEGFTIQGARRHLQNTNKVSAEPKKTINSSVLQDIIAELEEIEALLSDR